MTAGSPSDNGNHAVVHIGDYVIRRVEAADYDRGVLNVLNELADVGTVSRATFETRISEPKQLMFVVAVETSGRLVACGTLMLEDKLIHNAGRVGHVEDIVTTADCRGRGIAKHLVDHLTELARTNGCYKAILSCSDENMAVYEKCGYKRKENQMCLYFEPRPML